MGSEHHPLMWESEEYPFRRPEWKQSEKNWVIHIKSSLNETKWRGHMSPPSIFLTSSPLRSAKHEDFVPQVVAIGPYHSDLGPHHSFFPENQETQRYKAIVACEMERHKVMASKYVEQSLRSRDFGSIAQEFLPCIRQVRDEYDSELISCQVDEKFAYMLALDSAFVIQVLRSEAGFRSGFQDYYCCRFPRPLRKSVLLDFVLLENQIPLFLLLKVMQQDKGCSSPGRAEEALGLLIQKVVQEVLPFFSVSEESVLAGVGRVSKRKHLLDCLYAIVTYGDMPLWAAHNSASPWMAGQFVEKPTHFPRAVDLASCGIKIKAIEPGNMTSIRYDAKKAILYLPKVQVGDDTERILRNLVAYESHLTDEVHVLSYLRFMNALVDGPDDVAMLTQKRVLVQDIGSNVEVASIWNRVCMNTMRVCSIEYEGIAQQLMQHCQHRPNALRAEFKRMYLSRPWLTVSVLSGASMLIMTLLITVFTILLYLQEKEAAAAAKTRPA